jgi:thiol-disulfide isomerase/thioredoxin
MSKSSKRRVPPARRATPKAASSRSHHGDRRPPTKPAAAGPKRFRSRHPVVAALAPVAVVLAIIATMVIVKATSSSSAPTPSASRLASGPPGSHTAGDATALAPGVVASLSVPETTLDRVGHPSSVVAPSPTGDAGPVLRGADGKPVVTYIGAEWCPFCAAERWALAVALSRFGTFSDLAATHSSSSDVYPDTQTLSFYGSHYTSPYLDFVPVEEATNTRAVGGAYPTLQRPTAAESDLMARFDPQGSIPFLDIANKYVVLGASYSPQVLTGLSQAQIADQLHDPNSPVAQAIDGAANVITAAIVRVTGQQPGGIASSPVIAAIAKSLGA